MAKIAWRIAHAFTKGQKSAPAEFREVENQLYSLSAALTALKDVCGNDIAAVAIDTSKLPARFQKEQQDGVQSVAGILDSCSEILKHLEKVVESYSVVTASEDPGKSRIQRWSTGFVKNYKKVAWTTEAGDLAALRSQLMVHTNSLDLVLGIIVSSRTTRIEDSLRENSKMLSEIHSWWAQSLKDAVTGASEPAQGHHLLGLQRSLNPMSFEVHITSTGVSQLLCTQACLHDDWRETGSTQLFVCQCSQTGTSTLHPSHPRVENIALSPISFPFRQAGDEASWTLFKALDRSTNQMVSITIKNVAASDIVKLEESFIQPLAEARASDMLQQGISNQLAHLSPDAASVRALNLQSDLKDCHKLIDSVTFRVGHRNLSKPNVDGLSLLNYRELGQQSIRSAGSALGHAELSIYYGSDDTSVSTELTKSIVHSAKKLHEKLEEMRMELFVTSLQYPRPDETVVLHLQATEVQCEVAIISDAELLITCNRDNQHRLIVASRNKCTVLTQVLPDRFFTPASSFEPSFAAPTWLVQLEGSGKRKVYHYPDGFRFLSFRNTSAEKMFELGRTAVLQGAASERTLPMR
ncbi:hypothetical protein C8A01DRAFT_50919 [Parachaetomium inaequale]|uniref:Fungal N-terminal domain-containing protein n=1 Tax=Parachaetomium inaequale TaxID=2588326 RepID=A0AAN6P9G4_9PEZI|nr:hypothetical protein C8A01DRAFT_50919 [Parachaetomium inaequale]